MSITILGTGLLGSGFARAFLKKGESVRVWNRTPARAQALVAHGADAIADAADAVRGADRVHLVLADDNAVNAVLEAAAPGFAPATLVIDHSTTSPRGALERTAKWRERGITYFHAPVFMGPGNALESTGFMLVSGDRDLVARTTPFLAPMTGKVLDLGPRVDQAAAFKLIGNLLLLSLGAGFADIVALAQSLGIGSKEAGTLFDQFNPGAQLVSRYKRFTDAEYEDVSWDLAMARKDARLMQAEADRAGLELRTLPPLAAKMDEMIGRGYGELDWTIVGKDVLKA
jgi:3-hydroxyisobutyrate dehydrogenase